MGATGDDLLIWLREHEKYSSDQQRTKRIIEMTAYCRELCALMVQTKEQIMGGDHYGATRSVAILRHEYGAGNVPVKVLEARVKLWLPAAVDALLSQVSGV